MAFNPSPEIQVARDAAAKLGDADQCLVIALNWTTGQIQTVSYGKTRALCDDARRLGEAAERAVIAAVKGE